MDIDRLLLKIRQELGTAAADQAEDLIIHNAALTAEYERQQQAQEQAAAARDAEDQIKRETAALQLRIRFGGEETEELRVQIRLLELLLGLK